VRKTGKYEKSLSDDIDFRILILQKPKTNPKLNWGFFIPSTHIFLLFEWAKNG